MVCVLLSVIFHAKNFHTEGEVNRTAFMGPKTGREFVLLVSFDVQTFL